MPHFVINLFLDCIHPYRNVEFASAQSRSDEYNSESANNDEQDDKFDVDIENISPTQKYFNNNNNVNLFKYQENNKKGDTGFVSRILFSSLVNSCSSSKIKSSRFIGSISRKMKVSDSWNEDRIEIQKSIGDGAQAVVYSALDKQTNTQVAVKYFMFYDKSELKRANLEIYNLYQLCHPNIIAVLGHYFKKNEAAIVMNYADIGDLKTYVVSKNLGLSEFEAREIFKQVIDAVEYMHSVGVVNRDIKLKNILLSKRNESDIPLVQLCDFGLSSNINEKSKNDSIVGTPDYVSPEVLKSRRGNPYCGKRADIWSCGIVLYNMVTGCHPFSHRRIDELGAIGTAKVLKAVCRQRVSFRNKIHPQYHLQSRISEECKDLIRKCLTKDPEQRIKIEGIRKHAWFNIHT